jgi:class 3 adenylate cyclase/tetratricopeptide (TPR) repeat protein
VGSTPATAAPSERFSSPDAYTPRHLADRILKSRTALEDERKHVTVLFADLKGSTEMIAARDPEDARRLLDPVIGQMMEAIHFYEGTVNQVMGDGIMALFGAPIAHEDHAVRACYAALRIQETAQKRAKGARDLALRIRIGVNSGEVVVRTVGNDLRMDYSAVGQTTHVAARMEQVAVPGTIVISPSTARQAEGYVQVTSLGLRDIKGLSAPIEVFELTGAESTRSRLQARAARGLTKFIGRTRELAQLEATFERARQGHGQAVAVVADAGVGKSRLNLEFLRSHRKDGTLILECGCISHRKATAFLPITELLRQYFQIEARDEGHKIAEKVTGRVLSLDPALEPDVAAFLWLLDIPVDDPAWLRLDPQQRRRHALEGVKRLVLAETRIQPVILVVEDLHWVDRETQALLNRLVDSLPTVRLLLLLNYRPEYEHRWSARSFYSQIRLDHLGQDSTEELLSSLVGADPALLPLRRRLVEWTDGNPLFVEEIVRSLWETGALVGERGAYRLSEPIETIRVAPTVQDILAARIDRLADKDKRVLQSASVVGTELPLTILQAIVEEREEDLRQSVANLQASEFLYESRLFPDIEYTFRHALTRDVAYQSLLQDRRRVLHARIVEVVERQYADRLAEQVERLAHHALRGEIWDKAVTYLRQAGVRAHWRWANHEAVAWFEQALTALGHLPESPHTMEQAVDLRLDLRGSLYPLGRFAAIVEHLSKAQRVVQALGDQGREGWVSLQLGDCLRQMGRITEACPLIERARDLAGTLEDEALRLAATQYLGLARYAAGDFARAAELLRWVVSSPDRSARSGFGRTNAGSRAGFLAINLSWLARCLAERGDFEEGLVFGQQGVARVQDLDDPYSLALAYIGLGYLHLMRGDFTTAVTALERARAATRDRSMALVELQAVRNLALAYAYGGRTAEGIELLEHAMHEVESRGIGIQEATVLNLLAEVYLLAGRVEVAATSAERALVLAGARGQEGEVAVAHRLLGDIALHPDRADLESARSHYEAALGLGRLLGIRPLIARCHLGLGRLHGRSGSAALGLEVLRLAESMAAEMGMSYWRGIAAEEMRNVSART